MKIRPKVLYKIIFDIHSSSLDIFDLVGIDNVGLRGINDGALALLRAERTGAAGIHVGTEECYDRFRAGQKDAAILAGLPNVVERTQAEFQTDQTGYG